MIVVIWVLCRRFPGATLFEFIPKILGGLVGKILSLAYIFYYIAVASLILILIGNIKVWTFPNTPSWIIFACIISSAIYLVKENLRIIARYHMLISFSFIILIFLFLGVLKYLNVLYILPLGGSGALSILKGSKEAFIAMLGFDLLLVLYPFTQGNEIQRVKAASLANLGVTILYTFITICTLMFFSPEELKIVPEPVLYVLKALEYTVIERLDLVFLSVWILTVSASFMSYLYIASYGITKIARLKHHKKVVPFVGAICFCIALIPGDNLLKIEAWSKIISYAGLIFSVLIPILLLLLAILFRIKDGGKKS
jgi:spore germination protein (amino acid permease)